MHLEVVIVLVIQAILLMMECLFWKSHPSPDGIELVLLVKLESRKEHMWVERKRFCELDDQALQR